MPPRRRKRPPTPPFEFPPGRPEDEEVFSVHSIDDSSPSPQPQEVRSSMRLRSRANSAVAAKQTDHVIPTSERPKRQSNRRSTTHVEGARAQKSAQKLEADNALTLSDDSNQQSDPSVVEDEDEGLQLEEVTPTALKSTRGSIRPEKRLDIQSDPEEESLQLEDVDVAQRSDGEDADHSNAYAAAYEAATTEADGANGDGVGPVIYYDGKGQANGISIELTKPTKTPLASAKRKGPIVTARDRQIRLATHKLVALSMVAHARWRNGLINDDGLRDDLYGMVPNAFLEKLRMIHPKKVPVQNERVRQFETFLRDLARWWSHKFTLDPVMTTCGALRQPDSDMLAGIFPPVGKRVDGWIVESAKEREDRNRAERKAEQLVRQEKGNGGTSETGGERRSTARTKKGKRRQNDREEVEQAKQMLKGRPPLGEITLFGIGDSTIPVYLRLSKHAEVIRSVRDISLCVQNMAGSREISAQLFTGLCRALGIPARLVISIQTPSWSVGASKVASSVGTATTSTGGNLVKRKRAHDKEADRQKRLRRNVRKPQGILTSDEESQLESALSDASVEVKVKFKNANSDRPTTSSNPASVRASSYESARTSTPTSHPSSPAVRNGKKREASSSIGKDDEKDYRDDKWRNLEKPLEVKYVPKLRAQKPKALKDTELADAAVDASPVDTSAPPTMWVEVFSKPWQKWVTVDPIRGLVEPLSNRRMEPGPTDRSNRLVYVLAFEEDGFARDVTARYTKTLHSRVSRMRPPTAKKDSDEWWARVVAAVHRPEMLDRDAAEDVELQHASSREPMPSSVAAFKDHPVYALEKHIKRDEVIFPAKQAGTFQGMPVFLRSNVITCKSARQWYNDGRVVKEGEEALKWVKSRGYTLQNKRAEEEARQQGFDGLQEGLYAFFQTAVYIPPAVVDGKVPTNNFGNIDLFVDTMLPPGGYHIPFNGAGKIAKQLGVHYAEAIVGFEFRKHRSMPKLKGIVVAEEFSEDVMDAYWKSEQVNAEKEKKRKREKQIKEWKKKMSAAQIRERIRREYGHVEGIELGDSDEDDHEFSDRNEDESSDEEVTEEEEVEQDEEQDDDAEDLEAYRAQADDAAKGEDSEGGGFLVD